MNTAIHMKINTNYFIVYLALDYNKHYVKNVYVCNTYSKAKHFFIGAMFS